jgi:hypothetical protein
MLPHKRYRCRYCGTHLNAYLPWAQAPNRAVLLGHLGQQQHLDQLRPYLRRMEVEGLDVVLMELDELIEGETSGPHLASGAKCWPAPGFSHSVKKFFCKCPNPQVNFPWLGGASGL